MTSLSLLAPSRPFHRVTLTPHAQLNRLAQLLQMICGVRCAVHDSRPGVHEVVNGRVAYSACCEPALDAVEQALGREPRAGDPSVLRDRAPSPL